MWVLLNGTATALHNIKAVGSIPGSLQTLKQETDDHIQVPVDRFHRTKIYLSGTGWNAQILVPGTKQTINKSRSLLKRVSNKRKKKHFFKREQGSPEIVWR